MIASLIAAVQEMRTKPPTLFAAIVGAAIAGLGLTIVQRYHAGLVRDLTVDSATSAQLDSVLTRQLQTRDSLAEEIRTLQGQYETLNRKVYPAREDVDPLGNGETGDPA